MTRKIVLLGIILLASLGVIGLARAEPDAEGPVLIIHISCVEQFDSVTNKSKNPKGEGWSCGTEVLASGVALSKMEANVVEITSAGEILIKVETTYESSDPDTVDFDAPSAVILFDGPNISITANEFNNVYDGTTSRTDVEVLVGAKPVRGAGASLRMTVIDGASLPPERKAVLAIFGVSCSNLIGGPPTCKVSQLGNSPEFVIDKIEAKVEYVEVGDCTQPMAKVEIKGNLANPDFVGQPPGQSSEVPPPHEACFEAEYTSFNGSGYPDDGRVESEKRFPIDLLADQITFRDEVFIPLLDAAPPEPTPIPPTATTAPDTPTPAEPTPCTPEPDVPDCP